MAMRYNSPSMSLRSSRILHVNNVVFLILALAIYGGISDLRYKKAGGLRPKITERILFGVAVLLCIGFLVALGTIDAPGALGELNLFLLVILWGLWELGRWRVRRANPIKTDPN
jgi:hypothetical protein